MKLFRQSEGFIFSFGFDMQKRVPDSLHLGWCDPQSGEWDPDTNNLAGNIILPYSVPYDFIREISPTKIIAHGCGIMIEIAMVGAPFMWSVIRYRPD
jgi:hypothetical protein